MAAAGATVFVRVVTSVEAAEKKVKAADIKNGSCSRKKRVNSVDFFPLGTVATLIKRVPIVLQLLDRHVSGNRQWRFADAINDEARDIGRGCIDRVFNREFQSHRRGWAAVA